MGVLYTKNLYTEKGWTPTQIEMFLKIHTGPSGLCGGFATFESAGIYYYYYYIITKHVRRVSN